MGRPPPRYEFLGVGVDAVTIAQLDERVERAIVEQRTIVIANHNVNSVCLVRRDCKMRALYHRASLIHVDGMALVFVGRLLGYPFRREHRVTYVDWVPTLMAKAAAANWRVCFVGSRHGIGERAGEVLRARYPGLEFFPMHGYFDRTPGSQENERVLERISAYRPHILMVGLGMPRQEHWIVENLSRLEANAILTCGAAMDYVAGAVPTPPRWMGQLGLEWAYRLGSEPRRLARRYLIRPWALVPPLARDLWTIRLARRIGVIWQERSGKAK